MVRIPRWKKWLSYWTEVSLIRTKGEHNDTIEVCLHYGRLKLIADECIYSFDDLYRNFFETFTYLNLSKNQHYEILVLGMGFGSIPYMLEKKFQISASYELVELDATIIKLASEYALPRLKSECAIVHADAIPYIYQTTREFQFVIVDVFDDDIIPIQLRSNEILIRLKDLLAPDGILLYNWLYRTEADKEQTDKYESNVFAHVFDQIDAVVVEGNRVLIGYK